VKTPPRAQAGFRGRLERGEAVQVVAFHLGGEMHACDVALVEEALTRQRIHPLPDMPPEMLGVVLLRGDLVPVLDVAPALGLTRGAEDRCAVLVLGVDEVRVGVAADGLDEVRDVAPESLRHTPYTGGARDQYVLAVARLEAGLVNLIDLAELLRERATLHPREQP
jgi:purine-binding chemotaxis protein CheW